MVFQQSGTSFTSELIRRRHARSSKWAGKNWFPKSWHCPGKNAVVLKAIIQKWAPSQSRNDLGIVLSFAESDEVNMCPPHLCRTSDEVSEREWILLRSSRTLSSSIPVPCMDRPMGHFCAVLSERFGFQGRNRAGHLFGPFPELACPQTQEHLLEDARVTYSTGACEKARKNHQRPHLVHYSHFLPRGGF